MKPLVYLLVAGGLLGLSTTLAKVASDWGLAPFPFLAWSLLGATVLLICLGAIQGRLPTISPRTIGASTDLKVCTSRNHREAKPQ